MIMEYSNKFNNKIEKIINIEWDMFQNVHNIGGRASCQDDRRTFYIMRGSQFFCWNDKMTELYLNFLERAQHEGRNLVAEKYGYMMKYTDLEYYETEIKPFVPVVSEHAKAVTGQILSILLPWEKEFTESCPKLAGASRPTTSIEDDEGFISVETYEKGELYTYPEDLLDIYLDYVKKLKKEGKSMSVMTRDTMVKLYGFFSLEEAEAIMK